MHMRRTVKTKDKGTSLEQVASVQTTSVAEKQKQTVKPLKVKTISGLDIGPEELRVTKVRHNFKEIFGPGK